MQNRKALEKYAIFWYIMTGGQIMRMIKQLEEFRLSNKLSLEKLANQLGVSFSTVHRWFAGKAQPNQIQTYHIEKLLKKHKAL